MELNKYSKTLTQDTTQPAAQAMLYGIGLTDEDLAKAQVGIVSMGYDGNTCNMHLNDLAQLVKKSVWASDLVGLIFNTIGVSDGMSQWAPTACAIRSSAAISSPIPSKPSAAPNTMTP